MFWARLRVPRTLPVVIDLTDALPGEVTGIDVTVSRSGRALARVDRRYGASGAPQRVAIEVRAPPGLADVEATLLYRGAPAQRSAAQLDLREDEPVSLRITRSRR